MPGGLTLYWPKHEVEVRGSSILELWEWGLASSQDCWLPGPCLNPGEFLSFSPQALSVGSGSPSPKPQDSLEEGDPLSPGTLPAVDLVVREAWGKLRWGCDRCISQPLKWPDGLTHPLPDV